MLDIVNELVTPTDDQWAKFIDQALQVLLRHGVTSVHACELDTWPVFCRLADQNRLNIRVFYSAYYVGGKRLPSAGQVHGPLLSCDRVKLFADGALGVSTAAMSQPYLQHTASGHCNHGMLLHTQVNIPCSIHHTVVLRTY